MPKGSLCILFPILCINPFPMHSGELSQESLEELNLNRVTHNSEIGQHLVDPRSVPTERTSAHGHLHPPSSSRHATGGRLWSELGYLRPTLLLSGDPAKVVIAAAA